MALTRLRTGGITANAVVAASIAPGAVDITDIADGAVTENKLAANAVTEAKLAANAVTTSKIASNVSIQFAAGSNTAPSISVNGDSNTGIFFSAANTVDIATDGVARAQINSAGDFAINAGFGSVGKAYLCRAWVNFNGTGTPAIRDEGNVSSITDNGTGSYTMNFTTAMPDINYSVTGISSALIGTSETIVVPNFTPPGTETASTTTTFKFAVIRPSVTTAADVPFVYLSVFR